MSPTVESPWKRTGGVALLAVDQPLHVGTAAKPCVIRLFEEDSVVAFLPRSDRGNQATGLSLGISLHQRP